MLRFPIRCALAASSSNCFWSSSVLGLETTNPPQGIYIETPYLTWRCRRAQSRLAADDPAHRRIMAQAFGIVHVLVSGKPPEHGLPQQPDQCMAPVLAGACVGELLAR